MRVLVLAAAASALVTHAAPSALRRRGTADVAAAALPPENVGLADDDAARPSITPPRRREEFVVPAVPISVALPGNGNDNGIGNGNGNGSGGGNETTAADDDDDPEAVAAVFLERNLHLRGGGEDYVVKNVVESSPGVAHVYVRQIINRAEVINADININIRNGTILSYGDSFFRGRRPASLLDPKPKLGVASAFRELAQYLGLPAPRTVHVTENARRTPAGLTGDGGNDDSGNRDAAAPATTYTVRSDLALRAVPARAAYVQVDDDLVLAYDFQVRARNASWYSAAIDANSGGVARLVDWGRDWAAAAADAAAGAGAGAKVDNSGGGVGGGSATYAAVIPVAAGHNDPRDGPPERVRSDDAFAYRASQRGWHDDGTRRYADTRGNNVCAQANPTGADTDCGGSWARPSGDPAAAATGGVTAGANGTTGTNGTAGANRTVGVTSAGGRTAGLVFPYAPDFTKDPATYAAASATQLFYTINTLHDIVYNYGFDEKAGNFQRDNFGRGGKGGDPVIANAQDGTGTDNANFLTPPDGESGVMRMYTWDASTPNRDGVYDLGIVVHEYTHGISNRLTGGPANVDCLPDGEPGGMGEGWSDVLATILRLTPQSRRTDELRMADYAANNAGGLRPFPYTSNKARNPATYEFLNSPAYRGVHAVGFVWASILLEVFWNLVDLRGFWPDWRRGGGADGAAEGDASAGGSAGGNAVFLQAMLDGMKFQPCLPSFAQARDALVQAAAVRHGSSNRQLICAIWRGFAARGLGVNARRAGRAYRNGFGVPAECAAARSAGDDPGGGLLTETSPVVSMQL